MKFSNWIGVLTFVTGTLHFVFTENGVSIESSSEQQSAFQPKESGKKYLGKLLYKEKWSKRMNRRPPFAPPFGDHRPFRHPGKYSSISYSIRKFFFFIIIPYQNPYWIVGPWLDRQRPGPSPLAHSNEIGPRYDSHNQQYGGHGGGPQGGYGHQGSYQPSYYPQKDYGLLGPYKHLLLILLIPLLIIILLTAIVALIRVVTASSSAATTAALGQQQQQQQDNNNNNNDNNNNNNANVVAALNPFANIFPFRFPFVIVVNATGRGNPDNNKFHLNQIPQLLDQFIPHFTAAKHYNFSSAGLFLSNSTLLNDTKLP